MKNTKVYVDFITEKLKKLLSIDSPTGYTKDAIAWLKAEYEAMGYAPAITTKGGLLVQLAKGCEGNAGVLVETHTDTLGGMVAEVKGNGRLRLTALGGMNPNNAETENCVVITRDGKRYEGCFQMNNPSIHVNGSYDQQDRTYDNMEVVLDEMVFSKEETKALGIETGDIVCFETRTRITEKGYIKSRFLDDKLSVAILLGYAKYLKEENVDKETDKSGAGGEKEVSVKVEIPPVKRANYGEKKVVSGTDSLKEQQLKRKVAQYYGLEEACIEIWWEDDQGEMAVPAPVGSDLNDTVHAISGEQQ